MGRFIQHCPTSRNVVTQLWSGAPQQCHRPGDVWRRHGCATENRVSVIGGVIAGASARARSRDIRFDPVTPIDYHRPAAAKVSNDILARSQRPDRVRCCVDGRRVFHSGTARTCAVCPDHHHNAGSSLRFDSSLQRGNRTTFRRRAVPRVCCDIGSFEWVALPAADRVRRKEPFHALDVSGRCAVPLVYVAATDPLRAGRHPNLVAHAVVADRSAYRMRAMPVVVAGERRIVPARVADAVVDGIVPVVIVIGSLSVPAAIMSLERVMSPALTSVRASHRNSLTSEPQRPHIRRVRVSDARLDRFRSLRLRRRLSNSVRLRKRISNVRIAFYSCHVGTGG